MNTDKQERFPCVSKDFEYYFLQEQQIQITMIFILKVV
jgi:hypothetical protein